MLLVPFRFVAIRYTANAHFWSPRLLFSMTVPTFTLKNRRHLLQWYGMLGWVRRLTVSVLWQWGQRGPSGQRPLLNQRSAAASSGNILASSINEMPFRYARPGPLELRLLGLIVFLLARLYHAEPKMSICRSRFTSVT